MDRDHELVHAAQLLDFFYVAGLYLFAWIGVLAGRHPGSDDTLLLLIILGWAGAHLLIEVQTRYRFLTMPFLCIFAGYGILRAKSAVSGIAERASARFRTEKA